MELTFDAAIDLMDTYEDFLLAFKDNFAYDTKILMQFAEDKCVADVFYQLRLGIHRVSSFLVIQQQSQFRIIQRDVFRNRS